MRQSIPTIIAKFVAEFLLINYLAFLAIKNLASVMIQGNTINSPNIPGVMYINQLEDFRSTNFFQYYYQVFFLGNWRSSANTGQPINAYIQNHMLITVISYLLVLLLSFLLATAIYYSIQQKHPDLLSKFRGNWVLYVLVFLLPLVLIGLIQDPFIWLSDGSMTFQEAIQSSPFYIFLLGSTLISTAKVVSEMTMIPSHTKSYEDMDLDFPTKEAEPVDVTRTQPTSFIYTPLVALKSSAIFIFDVIFITTTISNLSGLTRLFRVSIRTADIFVLPPLVLYISLLILIPNFVLDFIINQLEEPKYSIVTFSHSNTESREYAKYIFYGFIGMSFLTLVYGIFVGFSSANGSLFLFDPNFVNFTTGNSGVLVDGHLLGTDFLGRDIFSRLFFSFSFFFLPIVLTILIRPLIVIIVHKFSVIKGIQVGSILTDISDTFPRTLMLILLGVTINSINSDLLRGPIFIISTSLLFWSWPAKYFERTQLAQQPNTSIIDKYKPLIPLVSVSIVLEYILFGYFGFIPQTSLIGPNISWGRLIQETFSNFPSKYLLKLTLLTLIMFGSIAGMMRHAHNTITKS